MVKLQFLLFLFLTYGFNLFSQHNVTFDSEAYNSILYQFVSEEDPGIAVGIVKEGEVVYEHYVGYANLEHGVKVSPNTRFNIASNAKQFTALCILKLAEEGKLKLDDDIRTYLPEIHPNINDPITLTNLITHTSGIRDYCDLIALTGKTWWQQFIDNGDVMDMLQAQRDLNFSPGTEYLYSNSNYILLAEIIEKVTGQSFDKFSKALFEELGMPNSKFRTHYGEITPHMARPYGNWGKWYNEPTITEVHGDGALFTTLQDQLKWEQIVQANDGTVLSQQLLTQSQSPVPNSIGHNYGHGVWFDTYKGLAFTQHDGVTAAYRATFLRFPEENLSIVVMSNNRNVRADILAFQMADQTLQREYTSKTYPSGPETILKEISQADIVGSYTELDGDGTIMNISEQNDTLVREIYQYNPRQLLQEEGSLYHYGDDKALKVGFEKDASGVSGFTIYKPSISPAAYVKLPVFELTEAYAESLNGTFFNDETQTTIELAYEGANAFTLTKNGRARDAVVVYRDRLRMNGYVIQVNRDSAGNVEGLRVTNDRIQNVIFSKTP